MRRENARHATGDLYAGPRSPRREIAGAHSPGLVRTKLLRGATGSAPYRRYVGRCYKNHRLSRCDACHQGVGPETGNGLGDRFRGLVLFLREEDWAGLHICQNLQMSRGRTDSLMPPTHLSTLDKLVSEIEQSSVVSSRVLNQISEILGQLPDKLSADEKLQAWKLSYRLWNTCVDLANNKPLSEDIDEDHARLRQAASDLLLKAGTIDGVDSCHLKIAQFYYKTGTIWHKIKNYGQASVCFQKAGELISQGQQECDGTTDVNSREEEQFLFDLYLAKSQTAWEVNHRALACSLLARVRKLLTNFPERCQQLAEQYFQHGQELVAKEDTESQSESIMYLEQAFEVSSEVRKDSLDESARASLSELKLQILRYLAAGHLQRENYESVLKQHSASVEACLSALEIVLQDPNRLEDENTDGLSVHDSHISSNKEQQCTHAILWNSGAEHFTAKKYETSIKLFEASMLYLPGDEENKLQRAKSFRVLCLCHIALLRYDRAAEFAIEAQKIEPNIPSAFLKFKIFLQTSKESEAAEEVEKMVKCPDFEPNFLTLAAHEAMAQNCPKVAINALSNLLGLESEKRKSTIKDVILIRNLVSLSLRDTGNQKEFFRYVKLAQTLSTDAGFESFFGSGSLGQQEAKWFASTSWNQGLVAIKTDSGVECLKMATKMLEKCRKVHRALAMSMESADPVDHNMEVYMALISFDIKGRVKDHKAQLEILYQCGTLSGFKAEHYLMMADYATNESHPRIEAATTALRMALKFMLSLPAPDFKLVAMTVRKQIKILDQQNKDGPEVLVIYRQSKEILANSSAGDYPPDEVQWLVATSWNRAGLHLKFQRFTQAETWMEVAIDLLKYAPQMESRNSIMVEGLNHVRQKRMSSLTIAQGQIKD
ncbi:hypothetical protein AXG93_961s1180 [Marchantia polymorpha subsp. ruderalis]|uniref:Protein ZIP4 homolog n=1 Tax=Marchantia polymorpha subsp. ruderalis TaxID=1480154 RepID=A0A176VR82_MARPO|nr:hypothetical protein AXG93_961s1180 [Marchantia polymorpha subsp. ruderalis]